MSNPGLDDTRPNLPHTSSYPCCEAVERFSGKPDSGGNDAWKPWLSRFPVLWSRFEGTRKAPRVEEGLTLCAESGQNGGSGSRAGTYLLGRDGSLHGPFDCSVGVGRTDRSSANLDSTTRSGRKNRSADPTGDRWRCGIYDGVGADRRHWQRASLGSGETCHRLEPCRAVDDRSFNATPGFEEMTPSPSEKYSWLWTYRSDGGADRFLRTEPERDVAACPLECANFRTPRPLPPGVAFADPRAVGRSPPEVPSAQLTDKITYMPGSTREVNAMYSKFKTEMCRNYSREGSCRLGDRCMFAHGESELRERFVSTAYKSESCSSFMNTNSCIYGTRCSYIH